MQAQKMACRSGKNVVILWRNKYLTTTLTTFRGNQLPAAAKNKKYDKTIYYSISYIGYLHCMLKKDHY